MELTFRELGLGRTHLVSGVRLLENSMPPAIRIQAVEHTTAVPVQGPSQGPVQAPTAMEDHPEGRLFGDPKATRALLEFLATTAIGSPQGEAAKIAKRAQVDDELGIEALDDEEREGEG